jgi:hypothetical protein
MEKDKLPLNLQHNEKMAGKMHPMKVSFLVSNPSNQLNRNRLFKDGIEYI